MSSAASTKLHHYDSNDTAGGKKKRKKVGFKEDVNYCEARDCLKLHLVSDQNDLHDALSRQDSGNAFSPSFVEEFFEDGKIYGYKGLRIDIWLHDSTFVAYAEVHYDESKVQANCSRKKYKDVETILKEIFGDGLLMDRGAFVEHLAKASNSFRDLVTAHGEVISSWECCSGPGSSTGSNQHIKHCEIVRMEVTDPRLREWRTALSPLVLLFVEGGRPIDDDPQWEIFIATERPKGSDSFMKVTGFCTVFRFYHYPDNMRLRISQILVLPPYQHQGYGFHLLESVNQLAIQRGCFDVNMEEPSEELQKLRDSMDTLRLLSNPVIASAVLGDVARITDEGRIAGMQRSVTGQKLQETCHINVGSQSDKKVEDVIVSERDRRHGWHLLTPPTSVIDIARGIFKISKPQIKRCWEMLILLHLDPLDKSALDTYKQLLLSKLKYEVFEKENKESGLSKKVIDVKNQYDSSKTFIMMKLKSGTKNNADISKAVNKTLAGVEDAVEVEEINNKNDVLQELLKERENEVQSVIEKVRNLRSRLSVIAV